MSMKRFSSIAVFALILVVACQAARLEAPTVGDWKPPKWYRGHDGPIFDVIKTSETAEQRHYYATKWVTTNITNAKVKAYVKFDDAFSEGTKRLDEYWGGANEHEEDIADTVPSFVLLKPAAKQTLQSDFTIEYFLPHELFDAPPRPNATELNIIDVAEQLVWVRVFGGYAGEKEVVQNVFDFIAELKDAGEDVDESLVGFASYDSALRVISRHNEIWVWPKKQPTLDLEVIRKARVQVQGKMERLTQAIRNLLP